MIGGSDGRDTRDRELAMGTALGITLRMIAGAIGWALAVVLRIVRPIVWLALLPLGVLCVLLAVVGGFALEARGLLEHRWELLAIGLTMIALLRIYDRVIGFIETALPGDGRDHR